MIMKKFTLLMTVLLLIAGKISANGVELELTPGWNCSRSSVVVGDPDAPQLPATVTLNANYSFITVDTEFNSGEYTHFKFVFGEPLATDKLAATCKGEDFRTPIPEGSTEFEGAFTTQANITRLGIQNQDGSNAQTFILNDVILYKDDGTEWHPTMKTAYSWTTSNAGTIVSAGSSVIEAWAFGQWGTLGYTFPGKVVPEDEIHRFVVTSSEPFPAGFQFKVVRGSNDGDAIYPVQFTEGATTAILELSQDNIRKSEDDGIDYFTGVLIQAMSNDLSLPIDVTMTYEVVYPNGLLSRERLPIVASTYGDDAKIIDPDPAAEVGENGLPVRVTLSSQWQAMGLWNEAFSVAEYPMYKIVLREKPADGLIQLCYRNESGGSQGGVYVPWETNPEIGVEVSEDGTTIIGEFNIDELGDDTEILAFFMQNRTGDQYSGVIEGVYLMNEEEEWIPTPGLGSATSIWNTGTTLPIGGSYDEDGNIWDAYVEFYSTSSALGYYSGTVEEDTYHKITFFTEEPIPAGITPMAYNLSFDENWNMSFDFIEAQFEGMGTNELSVLLPRSYQYLVVQYFGQEELTEPLRVRFTKILREVYEGSMEASGISETAPDSHATVKSVAFYNVNGIQSVQPARGLNIVRETLSDGTVRTRKVMIR